MSGVEIQLSRGLTTIVSPEDADRVLRNRWSANPRAAGNGGFYATRSNAGTTLYLHRFILGAVKGQIVDHADGNGLNNTRANLRFADASLNLANRIGYSPASGFRGVYAQAKGGFMAKIEARGTVYRGGTFRLAEDAARKRDHMALELFGEFAVLNFPELRRAAA